jgi:hypothetical protein
MKKQEQFVASAELAFQIRHYEETAKADNALYLDPTAKRARIREASSALLNRVCRISESDPSFDEAEQMAKDIVAQFAAPETAPVIPKTKEQIYEETVKLIQPLAEAELVGKNLCLKEGADKFTYFKAAHVEARDGMYNRLTISVSGPGFEVKPAERTSLSRSYNFATFKSCWFDNADLLLTGKDHDQKQWLYVLSDAEMKKQFDAAVRNIGVQIGIEGYTEEEKEAGNDGPAADA